MAGFARLTLEGRLGAHALAGRPAEQAFRRYMGSLGRIEGTHYTHTGHDRVDTSAGLVATMAPEDAHGVDFISLGGHNWEVQGFGRTGEVLLKLEKVEPLTAKRDRLAPGRQVRWFLFDQPNDAAWLMPHETILNALTHPACRHELVDGRKAGVWVPVRQVFGQQLLVDPFAWLKALRAKSADGVTLERPFLGAARVALPAVA